MLHRPFITRREPGTGEQKGDPSVVCLEAANNICSILDKYFNRLPGLPCDMVFSIFTAASVLLYHCKHTPDNGGVETRRRLDQCIQWLSVLSRSWQTAGGRNQSPAEGE